RNDGAGQHYLFRMRMAAGLLALMLSAIAFFAAREWFGEVAGVLAMVLVVFEPNIAGHSALVTTDIGVTLFFVWSVYAFYRYVSKPTQLRLLAAGVVAGLLLSTKHSGILLAPMLLLLIVWEVIFAERGKRGRVALRLSGAFAAIVVIGVVILWAFYGFRYAARPHGFPFPTVAEYAQPLSHFDQSAVIFIDRMHLLPQSYMIGLIDVKRMAQFYPTFVLGKQIAHGIWWYFPLVILIKTTLGMLALVVLSLVAAFTGRMQNRRALAFILIPWVTYLAIAMAAGMNIGARHILPLYAFAAILCGGGIVAWAKESRKWKWISGGLVAAQVVSMLFAFPNYIPYANEAWGGSSNTYKLLSDANADWGQQLYQVKAWQDAHPGQECWFAYFAYPEVDPATYGIRCHHLPNIDTFWLGGIDSTPAKVQGAVLLSAGDWSGCEWPSERLNPYRSFLTKKPNTLIDNGVLVYEGSFDLTQAAALSRAIQAYQLEWRGNAKDALPLAREAVVIDPTDIMSQSALGDSAAALGLKDEARTAWTAALNQAKQLEPEAQTSYVPDLEEKLGKL
ncbi:MAG: glycosyltransferase family 39 protein, partial [Acidobacteriota bacterium]|nr:glycosyltransferase family 39 protein [Acidobacteriota bacterium]